MTVRKIATLGLAALALVGCQEVTICEFPSSQWHDCGAITVLFDDGESADLGPGRWRFDEHRNLIVDQEEVTTVYVVDRSAKVERVACRANGPR